ncbi:MFS transporter [Actinomadura rupiterrae]|uniref:MFS transporter n=1 Tax=Actinomadura rupiterrae TaxID=559627 RepID=UPI0020A2863B|nr:MFS transporter [Actinomadura rupiterrae]MCP2336342.1 MFS family permease [Actinomadura rupiterrae]
MTVLDPPRLLTRPVLVLAAGVAVNRMGAFVQIFLVVYLTAEGYSASRAGIALTAFGVGSVLGVLLGGAATDRFGARPAIIGSSLLSAVQVAAIPVTGPFPALLAVCASAGLVAQMYRPAALVTLSALVPPGRRVLATAVYRFGYNVGATLGPLLGVLLFGLAPALVFAVDAASSALFALVAYAWLPATPRASSTTREAPPERSARTDSGPSSGREPSTTRGPSPPHGTALTRGTAANRGGPGKRGLSFDGEAAVGRGGSGERGARTRRAGYRAVVGDPRFLGFAVALLLISVVEIQYTSVLPLEVRGRGLPLGLYGGLVAANGLIVIAAEIPVTRVVQHWNRGTAIPAGIALIAAGITGFALPGAAGLVAATLVWTAGEMVAAPSAAAYPTLVSDDATRGRYIALSAGAQGLGYALGPALGIALWARNSGAFWLACALLGLLAAVLARWTTVRAPSTPGAGMLDRRGGEQEHGAGA